jgi:hypothetical protein
MRVPTAEFKEVNLCLGATIPPAQTITTAPLD